MQRLYFVQWLRVFLISLVVAHHAGQPYGPTGGEWPIHDFGSAAWLGPFFGVNAAFFMGFFFLIAGYFTGSSFDRKGAAAFVRDRLIRLGIPLLFVTFVLFGPLLYYMTQPPGGFLRFFFLDYIGRWQIEEGHMWFVAQLLAYSLLYAAWRALSGSGRSQPHRPLLPPGDRAILAYTLALAATGALVRTFSPQDNWVNVLWIIPAETAHLPQYASMFVIGIVAGYGGWFLTLPPAVGIRWFAVGVGAFLVAGFLSAFEDSFPVDFGVVWGFLEAFVAVGAILGLTVFFRRFCSEPGRWLERLDGNVYGVYIVHFFVVIALQYTIAGFDWPPTVKFLAVTAGGLVLSFALAAAIRQVPLVRRVI